MHYLCTAAFQRYQSLSARSSINSAIVGTIRLALAYRLFFSPCKTFFRPQTKKAGGCDLLLIFYISTTTTVAARLLCAWCLYVWSVWLRVSNAQNRLVYFSANMYLCNPHTNASAAAAACKAGRIIKYERTSVAGGRADGRISRRFHLNRVRTLTNSVQYFKRQDWAISSAQWSFFIAFHPRVISIMDGKIFRRCSSVNCFPSGGAWNPADNRSCRGVCRCYIKWSEWNKFLMSDESYAAEKYLCSKGIFWAKKHSYYSLI